MKQAHYLLAQGPQTFIDKNVNISYAKRWGRLWLRRGSDAADHRCQRIAAKRITQQPRQLAVAIWHESVQHYQLISTSVKAFLSRHLQTRNLQLLALL